MVGDSLRERIVEVAKERGDAPALLGAGGCTYSELLSALRETERPEAQSVVRSDVLLLDPADVVGTIAGLVAGSRFGRRIILPGRTLAIDDSLVAAGRMNNIDWRYGVFTSGAAGSSSLVLHDEASILRSIGALEGRERLSDSQDRWLLTHQLDTIGGITVALRTLLAGDALLLQSLEHPRRLLHDVAALEINGIASDPGSLRLLLRASGLEGRGLPNLTLVGTGSMALGGDLADRVVREWDCVVVDSYGSTELGGSVLIRSHPEVGFGTLPDVEIRVSEAANGGGDELLVRVPSPGLAKIERGEPVEIADADGWYRTGDLASIDDGRVTIAGRVRDSVIIAGRIVNCAAEETQILDRVGPHTSIALVPIEVRGKYVLQLCWSVESGASEAGAEAELREVLSSVGLSGVRLRRVDRIPVTRNRKLDRLQLAEELQSEKA